MVVAVVVVVVVVVVEVVVVVATAAATAVAAVIAHHGEHALSNPTPAWKNVCSRQSYELVTNDEFVWCSSC